MSKCGMLSTAQKQEYYDLGHFRSVIEHCPRQINTILFDWSFWNGTYKHIKKKKKKKKKNIMTFRTFSKSYLLTCN